MIIFVIIGVAENINYLPEVLGRCSETALLQNLRVKKSLDRLRATVSETTIILKLKLIEINHKTQK